MNKTWYKSKTFWASVCGVIGIVGTYLAGDVPLEQAIIAASAFLGAFGIRDGLK